MRFFAVLTLLLLSPFVGEFLLGNIPPDPLSWLTMIPQLILLYGGGAVLIREVCRRLGHGYPSMVLLALAYALIEEGIVLGTLFNREYLDLGLLDYGWVPALGTSPVWSVYVLTIHVVWSIMIPIVLAESLFPGRAREPWLRLPGIIVVAVIYLLGALLLGAGSFYTYGFFPEIPQLVTVAALAVLSILAGLVLRPAGRAKPGEAPPALAVAVLTLVSGSALILAQEFDELLTTYALMGAALVIGGSTVLIAGGRRGWRAAHTTAAVTGALGAYCWAGFWIQFSVHGFTWFGLISQSLLVLLAATLGVLASRGARRISDRHNDAGGTPPGMSHRRRFTSADRKRH